MNYRNYFIAKRATKDPMLFLMIIIELGFNLVIFGINLIIYSIKSIIVIAKLLCKFIIKVKKLIDTLILILVQLGIKLFNKVLTKPSVNESIEKNIVFCFKIMVYIILPIKIVFF